MVCRCAFRCRRRICRSRKRFGKNHTSVDAGASGGPRPLGGSRAKGSASRHHRSKHCQTRLVGNYAQLTDGLVVDPGNISSKTFRYAAYSSCMEMGSAAGLSSIHCARFIDPSHRRATHGGRLNVSTREPSLMLYEAQEVPNPLQHQALT